MKPTLIASMNQKTYTLMDKKQKFILSNSQMTNSYAKTVRFVSFRNKNDTTITTPYCLTVSDMVEIQKTLHSINPIDVRVFLDEVEVIDNDQKEKMIRDLAIIEQTHKSSKILTSVSASKLKNLLAENSIQEYTKALWDYHLVNALSIDKFKKIRDVLTK